MTEFAACGPELQGSTDYNGCNNPAIVTDRFSSITVNSLQNFLMKKAAMQAQIDRFLDAWFETRQFIQASNFNRFQKAGLSATQFMTLNMIPTGSERITIGDLARRLNLKPATVAQTIDSLEKRGFVARHRGKSDRRQILLSITRQGAQFQNAAAAQFKKQLGGILARMSPASRKQLIAGLESFVQLAGVRSIRHGAARHSRNS